MPSTEYLVTAWILVLGVTASAAELHPDIEYANVAGKSLRLDAKVPDGTGPFPIAILIHGGGWSFGDKARQYVPPRERLTDEGFLWFSIAYRLAPEHRWPAQINDVRRAIKWVKRNAYRFNGDSERVALMGYSAGAHLAAFAAATAKGSRNVQAAVLLAGPVDLVAEAERLRQVMPSLQNLFGIGPTLDETARNLLYDASPANHLHAEAPPFLLVYGASDTTVPPSQGIDLMARLSKIGVAGALVIVPDGTHDIRDWESASVDYERIIVSWLQQVLISHR